MASTPLHGLRYPVGTDPVNLATYYYNLATDTDLCLPVVQTATPAQKMGLVWLNPTNGITQISDGSTWTALTGLTNVVGGAGAVAGTFDVTKPRRHHYVRGQVTSDAQGLWTVATPVGCTAVLFAIPVVEMGGSGAACTIVVRADLGGITGVVLQARNTTGTGTALASTIVQYGCELVWQA